MHKSGDFGAQGGMLTGPARSQGKATQPGAGRVRAEVLLPVT